MTDGGDRRRTLGAGGQDDWVLAERGPFAGSAGHLDAPFRSTPVETVERMLDLARVGPGDRLVDLGCGDGRIVIAAARRGAQACGIDIDASRIAEARAAAQRAGAGDRARFDVGDLFALPLGGFTVVALFLLPHVNRWLETKLVRELAPGSRVVGHAFPMPNWTPAAQMRDGTASLFLWLADEPADLSEPVPRRLG